MEKITRPLIKVAPPGPKAKALIERDHAVTSPSYIKEYPLVMEGGQGSFVIDVDGNSYLDFMAGIAVTSTGHAHPKVVKAIQDAAAKFLHICGTDFYYESMVTLCETLSKSVPGMGATKVFLTNSGTEAVEGAIKLARHHTKRSKIIAFKGEKMKIEQDQSVILNWQASNAVRAELNDGSSTKDVDNGVGSILVSPVKTTTYTLTVYDSDGEKTVKKITIEVTAKPKEAPAPQPETPTDPPVTNPTSAPEKTNESPPISY